MDGRIVVNPILTHLPKYPLPWDFMVFVCVVGMGGWGGKLPALFDMFVRCNMNPSPKPPTLCQFAAACPCAALRTTRRGDWFVTELWTGRVILSWSLSGWVPMLIQVV